MLESIQSDLTQCINNPDDPAKQCKLETTLTEAVKQTVTDANFRAQTGCSPDFWRIACLAMPEFAQKPTAQSCLVLLLKLVRNAVVNEVVNQQLAIEFGALYEIEKIINTRLQSHDQEAITVMQIGTQAICNMMTGNSIALEFVWEEWMQDINRGHVYSELLGVNDDGVVTATMILILNCIRNSRERCQAMVKAKPGRAMLNAILDDLERLHSDEHNKNFELGYSIISQLIDYGHFVTVYRNIEDTSEQMNGRLTMLIKVIDSKIHAYKEKSNGLPQYLGHVELKTISGLVRQLCQRAVFVMEQVIEGQAPPSALEIDDVSEVYTTLVLVLQTASTLLTTNEDGHADFKEMLSEDNVMQAVTDLLSRCETMDQNKQPGFNYLKRDSVRLLGALCYEDRRMQDKIREIGGIPLILAQCKIEDANPYLREYAILAIRNILKDNPDNQALIAQMEPKEAVQTDGLSEMGLKAKLVDGKVKIEKA
ncbi:spinocerebellar ataxia type 10 protein domain-containing protein [Zychaea mexicana]|uniref:spinocerebellar ataxia type 10 protein domain-containing protein n=1 Tax=Zychaea mexicana TaxID=64656 RepID=UPI0022FDFECF|nr:spinocerebellar ataxia type 10 protein domain-containing protein [Zychaea mexicana]KAI9498139.1 spinocerebellar ataxia type 10 protein domain-containing protein [Zychaea mexicana]